MMHIESAQPGEICELGGRSRRSLRKGRAILFFVAVGISARDDPGANPANERTQGHCRRCPQESCHAAQKDRAQRGKTTIQQKDAHGST